MSETILERQVRAPETDTPAPQSFDFDRRAFALRIILCACLGVCSIVISIMAWDVMPTLLLLTIALPLTIVIAWFSGLRLRMAPPIIRLDRDGIWDRRLGIGPVPWRRIRAIELDRNADVVLILADGFRPADNDKHAGSPELFTSGSGYQAGKIRIKLDEIDTTLPDFLAAIEAMLPHDMQAPSCPAVLRRRPQQLVRPIFAGVVAGMMVGILVVAFGASRENTVIYRDLGAAKDLGIQPGDGVGAGFGRKGQPPANGAIDERVRLGHMYYGGYGVPQDDVRAARQFSLAAADGVAHGQAALGFFRENGIGVPQDFIKALNWYRKASEQGDSWARTRLALMYRDGRGVPRDMEHAFKLFKSAAQQGEVSAQYFLAEAYENGWGMAENAKEAIKWYGDAAAQGHAKAEYRLGILYSDGRSMPRNEAQAVSWFERSARQGYAPAQFAFGMAYELGLGVPLDPIRALLWYSLAEWHGHAGVTHRRDQYLRSLSEVERQAASLYRRRWLRENFLSDDLVGKFREYQKMRDPKAFAASMNGAWAISEGAGNQGDAARAALTRCRRLAQICLLYALGDQVVIGIDLREVNALIMSESRRAAR